MNETSKTKINPNGKAMYDVLADRKGEVLAFAEIAHLANVEPKTGFLTSAKKIALANKAEIVKVENGVKVAQKTVTEYPSGLKVEADREVEMAGYKLVDKE